MTLLFLDIETTGLKPDSHVLELAYFLTDDQGKMMDVPQRHALPYCWEAREQLEGNAHVLEMHRSSGLLVELERPGKARPRFDYEIRLHQIRHDLRDLVSEQEDPKKVRLAGFSVHFDATMLLAQWDLTNWAEATGMSHRYMDVRVLVDGVKAATGIDCGPQGDSPHRAYEDCLAALESYKAALEIIRGRQPLPLEV
jgi:oligoribonuclease (3'-5' exoribonuclease)